MVALLNECIVFVDEGKPVFLVTQAIEWELVQVIHYVWASGLRYEATYFKPSTFAFVLELGFGRWVDVAHAINTYPIHEGLKIFRQLLSNLVANQPLQVFVFFGLVMASIFTRPNGLLGDGVNVQNYGDASHDLRIIVFRCPLGIIWIKWFWVIFTEQHAPMQQDNPQQMNDASQYPERHTETQALFKGLPQHLVVSAAARRYLVSVPLSVFALFFL